MTLSRMAKVFIFLAAGLVLFCVAALVGYRVLTRTILRASWLSSDLRRQWTGWRWASGMSRSTTCTSPARASPLL